MLFPTFDFLYFFVTVLILNWFLKKWPIVWRLFLLVASYYFYSVWDVRLLLILVCVSFFNFFTSWSISNKFLGLRRFHLVLSVIINIFILFLFKYYDFFRFSLGLMLHEIGLPISLPLLYIMVPIGMSFYIFRAISYNADVYSGKISSIPSPLDVLLYISFFPQILAGPIMRASDFITQLKDGGAKKIENLWECSSLIILGLFKKLVISSYLTIKITNDVFAVPENHSRYVLLLSILAYSLVIYFDFSSYSDMAIGFAGLLGFKSPINFDGPYLATNLKEFWRKWHMTLSFWFRDYVYIPLGGNKLGFFRKYFNLVIVMVLAGLWHGAALTFIVWGFLHGMGLVFTHAYHDLKGKPAEVAGYVKRIFSILATFVFVSSAWVFFASNDVGSAISYFWFIIKPERISESVSPYIIFLIILGCIFFIFEKNILRSFNSIQEKLPVPVALVFIILFILLTFELGPSTIPPFIYFRF